MIAISQWAQTIGEVAALVALIVGALAATFRFLGTYILAPVSRRAAEQDQERLENALGPMRDELSTIREEVTYNGGASLKDGVRRIDRRLTRLEGAFDEHDRWQHNEAATKWDYPEDV